jgi:hypothetical protein
MAARTGLARAMEEGNVDRITEMGIHLGRINAYGTLCYYCAPWEGRTVALDAEGVSMGYVLRDAFVEHPNGGHMVYPFVEGVTGERNDPEPWMVKNDRSEYYHRFRDEHEKWYQFSRQGFSKRGEVEQWRAANPGVPDRELRGPRWRYSGINNRRLTAIENMLQTPGLDYKTAMEQQTRKFMQSRDYHVQRPEVTPSAQRRNVLSR